MRKLLAAVISAFALVAMATPATAAEVTRTPLPSTGTVPLPHLCGFDVRLDLVNKETLTSFFDDNGNLVMQVISGSSFGTFTNLSSGKTINVNLSGPAQFTFNPDGSLTISADGPQGFVIPLLGLGGPVPVTQFSVGSGHVVYSISPTGITLVSKIGSFQDVCPMLS